MACPPITIRIMTGEGAMDWAVEQPQDLLFSQVLEALSQIKSELQNSAFEYVDEDGERITVRSEEEMTSMLSQYIGSLPKQPHCEDVEPLMIFPKANKPTPKRNIHDLKVQTKDGGDSSAVESQIDQETGSRKRSGDIREILATGNINNMDLVQQEILGSGSFVTVYKAYHRTREKLMAVKVIPLDISYEAQKQIIAELEILNQCHSPVIIGFYGAYVMENRISICTEYMDGGSLEKHGKIPQMVLGRIAVSVVKGLQYLWSLKILHRDVKPSNILVNSDGQVKLCDFGVSVQVINHISKTFIGTNAYMAPERIKGLDYSIPSDVWSLGVTLFELACGEFPYESARKLAAKPMDLFNSIVQKAPPQLCQGAFPDSLVDFVSQCMKKEEQMRPAPHDLMRHPYVQLYNDHNFMSIIAAWVRSRIQEQQKQQQQQAQ
ncbi:hypothetical protein CAPTEDRAFT_173814 [Capitella teleta]|uniref:mitogen-activated protein kinase kinase n=1 Tax=Capitella teleta TaxID=283909 RepID=R7UF31_CAPTE|nr:hypothetical protein CAPTEDRAFT_173814 [Capitella teleta]|eukprot:ELU04825.1 hypothetical protein CAPTEDRAFT_173814 [Capitella teleta]